MTDIAEVISWKFNDQPGMRTRDGEIIDFPGGVPSQEDQDAWTLEYKTHKAIMVEIERLELLETPRRLAEAVLTDEGKMWLQNNRGLIAQERAKLQ